MARPTIAGLTTELRRAQEQLRDQAQLLDESRNETTAANAQSVELSEQLADMSVQKEASDRLLEAACAREVALRATLRIISRSSRFANSVQAAKDTLDKLYPFGEKEGMLRPVDGFKEP
jgi:predicted  nucleic acid-binding Zn-ribbon protein